MCEWGILERNLRVEEQGKKDNSLLYKTFPGLYEIVDAIQTRIYVWQHPNSVYAIPKRKINEGELNQKELVSYKDFMETVHKIDISESWARGL
jgi:hypothetical protein